MNVQNYVSEETVLDIASQVWNVLQIKKSEYMKNIIRKDNNFSSEAFKSQLYEATKTFNKVLSKKIKHRLLTDDEQYRLLELYEKSKLSNDFRVMSLPENTLFVKKGDDVLKYITPNTFSVFEIEM